MATQRDIINYNDEIIHQWLESLPQRGKAKHIRMAIRYYINVGSKLEVAIERVGNATDRQHFSYDDEEDKDIHDWIQSLPRKEKSERLRLAIRSYIDRDSTEGTQRTIPVIKMKENITNFIEPEEKKAEVIEEDPVDDSNYIDIGNDLANLGK